MVNKNENNREGMKPLQRKHRGMPYLIRTPWWLKRLYPRRVWNMDTGSKVIYLSFDDGPHPLATPFVLDELKKYNAKATFFCIGKNVAVHPALYERILAEGHAVGNHTYDHLNGWKTGDEEYLRNISEAAALIQSPLFRPPYGKIRSAQAGKLSRYRIIMWDVLSGDFDNSVTREGCYRNVINHTNNGSIVVFHDSEKAWNKLSYTLPLVLEHFSRAGYLFSAIS